MFVSRRKYDELLADYERVLEQRDDARRRARTHLTTTRTAAGQYTTADAALERTRLARIRDAVRYGARIDRLAKAVARLRAEVAAEVRRADRIRAAYDHAVGLDNPSLDYGAQWQERRTDRPRLTAGGPK